MNEWAFYIEELKSEECFCGQTKKSGFSFCFNCYKKLTKEMQKDLYKKIGKGYEQAYDEAFLYLKEGD